MMNMRNHDAINTFYRLWEARISFQKISSLFSQITSNHVKEWQAHVRG